MNSSATLAHLKTKQHICMLQIAKENASEGGITSQSLRTEKRLARAIWYLQRRVTRKVPDLRVPAENYYDATCDQAFGWDLSGLYIDTGHGLRA